MILINLHVEGRDGMDVMYLQEQINTEETYERVVKGVALLSPAV
jgi:hypothetical protein